MFTLPVLDERAAPAPGEDGVGCGKGPEGRVGSRRLPDWLKRPLPAAGGMSFTRKLVEELGLETVCESARCPNRSECWTRRTATFMILGDVCTRPCGFCAVKRGRPDVVALDEPERLAEACRRLGLRHVVITSVTRDDLPDGGAEHFRRCVVAVRQRTGATIEVLTPDFDGRPELVDTVLLAKPEVFNHNLETVARLQQQVRRKSRYDVSLSVLEHAKRSCPEARTKSGLMLGLGETIEEVIEAMADLRAIGCDLLTLGQYLQPSPEHLPVVRYLHPTEFDELGRLAPARVRGRGQRAVRPLQLSRRRDGSPEARDRIRFPSRGESRIGRIGRAGHRVFLPETYRGG